MRPQIGADEGAEGAVSAVQLCGGGEAACEALRLLSLNRALIEP
jgi:hypothetical protein